MENQSTPSRPSFNQSDARIRELLSHSENFRLKVSPELAAAITAVTERSSKISEAFDHIRRDRGNVFLKPLSFVISDHMAGLAAIAAHRGRKSGNHLVTNLQAQLGKVPTGAVC